MVTKAVDEIASYANLTSNVKDSEKEIINLENYMSKKVSDAVNNLTSKSVNVITLGSGKYVINQYPLKGISVVKNDKVFILTNKKDYVIPDMSGWSINDVRTYANLAGITLTYEGYGYVESQSIEANTSFSDGATLHVTLKQKSSK